nr:MAG TPA: hypothetical protein [Caudoviricetes sp.]
METNHEDTSGCNLLVFNVVHMGYVVHTLRLKG